MRLYFLFYDFAMRILIGLLVPCLFLKMAAAQDWSCPSIRDWAPQRESDSRSQNQNASPAREYRLQGSIGSKAVRMYLNLDEPVPRGLFYAPEGDWTPVFLFGGLKSNRFDFDGESEDEKPVGRLQGQFVGSVFAGQWMPAGSDKAERVHVSVVPAISCNGDGNWRQFDSPKWPLSFSYPASWKLMEETSGNDRHIRLTCPDPQEMIDNNDVFIKEGKGQPEELTLCGKQWRYGAECNEDVKNSAFDHTPSESVRHGMKFLDVSGGHEWRAYCRNGGYVGQTDGTDIFLLSRDNWIEISQTGASSDIVGRIGDTVHVNTAK